MAINYKVLGQSFPASAAATTLYAVPASTQAVVSTIVVCNQSAAPIDYRIAVRPGGASLQSQHYLVYDVPLNAVSTQTLTLGITLDSNDVITVYADAASMSFNAFGTEITL